VLGTVALLLVPVAVVAALLPQVAGWVVAVLAGWLGVTAALRAFLEFRKARESENHDREQS
jgi:hypothetical protein